MFFRLWKYGLKLNAGKTLIAAGECQYLGYTINGKGITLSKDKTKAIQEFEVPKDIRQVREFLGLCNYFRFLIPHFSIISAPLVELSTRQKNWGGGNMPEQAK